MRRNKRDFGRLMLIAIFLFVAVLLPNLINAISRAAGTLGTFAAGETGIKLCATISGGNEDALRFNVTNNQGFQADVVVPTDTCKNIHTEAATYHVRQYVSQEYAIDSVSGGTISADDTDFVATASGQYSIVYANTYSQKPYLHNFGYTSSATASSAVEVTFDANGGTGTMNPQSFGLNSQQTLTVNAFTRVGYNFDGWNTKADGTGTSYADEQALTFATGGELKLYAQWQEHATLYNTITSLQNNGVDTTVDFTTAATTAIGNGNGLNIRSGTENDTYPVYYFRGQVSNNNVIWANECWKVVRTTDGGGTKMIYNGVPTDDNGAKKCLATNEETQVREIVDGVKKGIKFNEDSTSPADVGYMFGVRLTQTWQSAGNRTYIFANNVTLQNDGSYKLSDTAGDYISGTWANKRLESATRYHYFCTDGASVCDSTKIGYIYEYANESAMSYLSIGGYADIEAAKQAMFTNSTDSKAKTMIDAWFESENLDDSEDDLEDTIFCNDRSFYSGGLKSKDSDATPSGETNKYSYFGSYGRNAVKNAQNNYEPSLDCSSKNDSFTKTETATTNGALTYKTGLITLDELTLAGSGYIDSNTISYLTYGGINQWSASPNRYGPTSRGASVIYKAIGGIVTDALGLRPMVSLKNSMKILDNGADGTTTNPYIVE